MMSYNKSWPFIIWFIVSGAGLWILFSKGKLEADLTFFLPYSRGVVDQLLTRQLQKGPNSQLIFIGIQGVTPPGMAHANKNLARVLRQSENYSSITNGEGKISQESIGYFLKYRYFLSPSVSKGFFSAKSINDALKERLKRLNSSFFILEKRYLGRDPTGELLRITKALSRKGPQKKYGVWFSKDLKMSLLMVRTKASAYDLDSQDINIDFIQKQFNALDGSDSLRLFMSGPPVFSVMARKRIRQELTILSAIGTILISFLLWLFYRSVLILFLIVLPLATAILLSSAVIVQYFGSIHGITLVFGITIIGVGIDYPIHIITHLSGDVQPKKYLNSIGRTMALGILTTCTGYLAMLMAGIKGLVQISLFAITGLLVAGFVSRFLIPPVISHFTPLRILSFSGRVSQWIFLSLTRLRWVPYLLLIVGGGALAITDKPIWNNNMAALSPLSDSQLNLDRKLRNEMEVPQGQKYIVVLENSAESVLVASEWLKPDLDRLVEGGKLQGYKMAALFLPSIKTQRARQKSLPSQSVLRNALATALNDLPFKKETFDPFLRDVQESKSLPVIELDSIDSPIIKSAMGSLLFNYNGQWVALILLEGDFNAKLIEPILQSMDPEKIYLLDLKTQTDRLMRNYRKESLSWFFVGAILILLVLFAEFRSALKVFKIALPVITSIVITACWVIFISKGITIIHLISLLLVAGVGIDYGVFLQRHFSAFDEQRKTLQAILMCNITTLLSFMLLIFSKSRVLFFIGVTVSFGVFSCIVLSVIIHNHSIHGPSAQAE